VWQSEVGEKTGLMEVGEGISDDLGGIGQGLKTTVGTRCVSRVRQESAATKTCEPQLVGLGCCSGNKRGGRDVTGGDYGLIKYGLSAVESG